MFVCDCVSDQNAWINNVNGICSQICGCEILVGFVYKRNHFNSFQNFNDELEYLKKSMP